MRITDLVMQYIEYKIIQKSGLAVKYWKRYVDNVFSVARDKPICKILEPTNTVVGPSIKFTIELEANCQLPFLDIYIDRKKDTNIQHIETPVYHKPNFSGQYLHFVSKGPAPHKIEVIKTLATISLKYCSTEELFMIEVVRIFTDLDRNGYLFRWIKLVFIPNCCIRMS